MIHMLHTHPMQNCGHPHDMSSRCNFSTSHIHRIYNPKTAWNAHPLWTHTMPSIHMIHIPHILYASLRPHSHSTHYSHTTHTRTHACTSHGKALGLLYCQDPAQGKMLHSCHRGCVPHQAAQGLQQGAFITANEHHMPN